MNNYYTPTINQLIEAFLNGDDIYTCISDQIVEVTFSDRSINSLHAFIEINDK